jgi:hypothetical protein
MNKIKLLISILLLLFSGTMFTIGAIFVTQNIGMIALIIFGGVGVVISFAFLGMTMSDSW